MEDKEQNTEEKKNEANSMDYLKPCPFCGSKSLMVINRSSLDDNKKPNEYNGNWTIIHEVEDGSCILSGSYASQRIYRIKRDAIEAWNKRANEIGAQ